MPKIRVCSKAGCPGAHRIFQFPSPDTQAVRRLEWCRRLGVLDTGRALYACVRHFSQTGRRKLLAGALPDLELSLTAEINESSKENLRLMECEFPADYPPTHGIDGSSEMRGTLTSRKPLPPLFLNNCVVEPESPLPTAELSLNKPSRKAQTSTCLSNKSLKKVNFRAKIKNLKIRIRSLQKEIIKKDRLLKVKNKEISELKMEKEMRAL